MTVCDVQYHPASTDWFAEAGLGLSIHWTAQSRPTEGATFGFDEAVRRFDVPRFLDSVCLSGATYLLFTATHAIQSLPAPCAAIDNLLAGRTCRRDLIQELARECNRRSLRLLLYYNHSCNGGDDPVWQRAVGYHDPDKRTLAENICRIVRELAARYGDGVAGWWFDSCYSIDPSGPLNHVTTDMNGFRFPWEALTDAAKAACPSRIVTYNPGARPYEQLYLYTTHQDYLAGEALDLGNPPLVRLAANGLQNHRWLCADNTKWVHSDMHTPLHPPRFPVRSLAAYLKSAFSASVPVTLNIDIDQHANVSAGTISHISEAWSEAKR